MLSLRLSPALEGRLLLAVATPPQELRPVFARNS
jgi:hypothetical protein